VSDSSWYVVGLGNPGDRYEGTRHSVGRAVAAELADRLGAPLKRLKGTHAHVAEGRTAPGGPRLTVAVLDSFMNLSGGQTAALLRHYHAGPDRLIVVRDDLDLPFAAVRIRAGGGHGGHNGVRDIIGQVGGNGFVQVRCGIGRPAGRQDPADFVLERFAAAERPAVRDLVTEAADLIEIIAADGVQAAQQECHRRAATDSAADDAESGFGRGRR
jgi:PTH1 family peptidyl-tRNA hydrolase